ncbi:MAG: M3 family metallopeptidase [Hyphomicrobiaceae bacterium]|nr:M3 family metallopeptidase [Hyphomicrobiaceae bacterium]
MARTAASTGKTASGAKAAGKGRNPLLSAWTTPFEVPPFDRIKVEHFRPAFDAAFAENLEEIEAIAASKEPATFANTIEALERAGKLLDRVSAVFYNLAGTDTTPEIQAIERELAPRYAKHSMRVYQDARLFKRVDALFAAKDGLGLTLEQKRVIERYHRSFVRSGAALDAKGRKRMAQIAEKRASIGTAFGQNVLADEQAFLMVLEEGDLAGLPDGVKAAAAQLAAEHGHKGKYAVSLARSSVEGFLQFAARRDLREKAYLAWRNRGANGGKTDNRGLMRDMLALRLEGASLLGFKTAADAALEFTMAKTPQAVRKLLMDVWEPARRRAEQEREDLQRFVAAEGGNFQIAGWDWRYYAEKVRKARFDVDEAEVKPYLQLDNVIAAAFDVAHKLFGLKFAERTDLPVYHADVRTWEATDSKGRHVGIFYGDYFARPSKRSGAWMTGWRWQERMDEEVAPVIVNVMNFAKGAPGEPTLLSIDDARTLFHEFGHALHGLLSNVTYPSVTGTSVERDFVELPSQLYEHWFMRPEVLRKFARHYRTGKPVPEALLDKIKAARNFNQGFSTVEYIGSAIVDLELHVLKDVSSLDVDKLEKKVLGRIGMLPEIGMRHRIPHFQHIIGGYASGYYSYMWSEVMDADAFSAFEEAGNVFDKATAKRLLTAIYSSGGTQDPADAYIAFRGRLPTTDALLEKRGLSEKPAAKPA